MPREVVYIASCPHSGSTLLDLVLGAHPRFVGLGELYQLLRPDHVMERTREEECSCGKVMVECDFWAPVLEQLLVSADASAADRYGLILDAFHAFFGEDKAPVDSSKYLTPLKTVAAVRALDLKVVHLIRDVRAWAVSMRQTRRRKGEFALSDLWRKHGFRAFKQLTRRSVWHYFGVWHDQNRAFQAFLHDADAPALQIGYDELCLYPHLVIPQLCAFLGVEPDEAMATPDQSASHSVFGNRMRGQAGKRSRILYDNRWFASREWLLPALLRPRIMAYNTRQVYGSADSLPWHS